MRQLLPTAIADVDPCVTYAEPLRAPSADRPWVMANMVASIDGRAAVRGRTAALSSPADRAVFKLLRALADVVLVGAGTVRAERYGPVTDGKRPPVAVISRSLDLDWDSPLFSEAARPTEVLTCEAADPVRLRLARKTAEVIVAGDKQVDLRQGLAELAARGHGLVLCEGGPLLLGELVAADMVDELCFTVAPLLAGGIEPSLIVAPPMDPPRSLRLASLIEDDGALLTRYLRAPAEEG